MSAPDRGYLRRLAEVKLARPRVLSIYLDLRPSEFATPAARASEVRSLLDEADRRVRNGQELSREDRRELRRSLARVRAELEGAIVSVKGAHGLAIFSSAEEGLFEVVKVPFGVQSGVVIDRSPYIQPLAALAPEDRWCVALVNRSAARLLRGSPERLVEVEDIVDEVHGRHDQGGWSQARFQRSVDKEAADHLRRAADALFRHFERVGFDHLLVGGPPELVPDFESKLHPYVAERVAGRIEVDVENTNVDQIRDAAQPAMEEFERKREREALDRLAEGTAAGRRAAAGLESVLEALNEQRVEMLLLDGRFSAPGVECPRCGWLGPEGTDRCPADGTEVERRADITEPAVERALRQSAEVRTLRYHDLGDHGGIGALLRF